MTEGSPQPMTASKNLNVDNSNSDGDWMVVVPRRGKQKRRSNPNTETNEQASMKVRKKEAIEPAAWAPTDIGTDPEKESKLMQKIETCIIKLENSDFYHSFLEQIETEEVLKYFTSVLASEPKMQMVIYGIGSIDSYEIPRVQLALAILIKRKFDWIGDIQVFDPVISTTESKVLEALGCSVLLVNEEGRRQASTPTLFFMPHCEAVLYNNLLEANWKAEFLKRMVVFGNSFARYTEYMCEFKGLVHFDYAKYVVGIQKFSKEVELETVSDEYFRPFHDSSWHFFNQNPEMDLELKSIQL